MILEPSFCRFGQGQFWLKPLVVEARLDRLPVDASLLGPIADVLRFAKGGDKARFCAVSNLLGTCGPAAVLWRVMTIIVDSVELMIFGGRSTHVLQESLEIVLPSGANRYSSASIPRIAIHARIGTAPNHRIPGAPFFGASSSSSFAMLPVFALHQKIMA